MMQAIGISKDYRTERGTHRVLDNVSFALAKGEKLAVLGRNGAGKSTLIRILGGVEVPSAGSIEIGMSISWPLALNGAFAPVMTGNDNMRFIARIYRKPFAQIRDYVEDFAQLGKFMSEPMRTWSTGMRARFSFALSLAIDFDCYLIDEVIAAGDQRFQRRSHEELFEKRTDRSMILAGHVPDLIHAYCAKALVLHRGRGKVFDDLELALSIYNDL
jgi:capsular polysaccharide transport system ATP-binding protein